MPSYILMAQQDQYHFEGGAITLLGRPVDSPAGIHNMPLTACKHCHEGPPNKRTTGDRLMFHPASNAQPYCRWMRRNRDAWTMNCHQLPLDPLHHFAWKSSIKFLQDHQFDDQESFSFKRVAEIESCSDQKWYQWLKEKIHSASNIQMSLQLWQHLSMIQSKWC